MKCLILMFMIFVSIVSIADAEGLFDYDRVDFFNSFNSKEKTREVVPQEKPQTITDEWAEPIISPQGSVSIYVPPSQVKDFLDKPSPENAKAYLEWNQKRIKKFILAQEVLAKEVKEIGFTEDTKAFTDFASFGSNSLMDNARLKANTLFYFMLKGCPACQRETRVIEDIFMNHPEIKIEAFADGFSDGELEEFKFPVRQDNGMSQILKVNSYPAILVINKKKEKYFVSGYVDKDRILGLF